MNDIYSSSLNPNPYYREFEDSYYSNAQKFDKQKNLKLTPCNPNDRISDESFKEAERLAEVSPYNKKDKPDLIENITLQMFTSLYSLADGVERKEIEAAIAPMNYNEDSPLSKPRYNRFIFHSFRETNFYDDDCDYPVHTQNVIRNVLSALADLFLGWNLSDEGVQKSSKEMIQLLSKNVIIWNNTLEEHYSDYFQCKIGSIFDQAEMFLKNKQSDEQLALAQRVTFYAMLIISVIGKLVNQKVVTVLGILGSSVTLLFMIKHYGITHFKKFQQEAILKASIDRIYYETASHRLNLSSSNPSKT